MPGHKRMRTRLGRLIAGAGLLTATGAVTGTGLAATAGAAQLAGYGSSALEAPAPGAVAAPGVGPTTSPFTITGKVSGLFPGKTLPLTLTVTNPDTVAITVTSITTGVSNASTTCLAANVKVTSFTGSLTVGARSTGKVTVHATMSHGAPNACKGATFPLHYSGTATGA